MLQSYQFNFHFNCFVARPIVHTHTYPRNQMRAGWTGVEEGGGGGGGGAGAAATREIVCNAHIASLHSRAPRQRLNRTGPHHSGFHRDHVIFAQLLSARRAQRTLYYGCACVSAVCGRARVIHIIIISFPLQRSARPARCAYLVSPTSIISIVLALSTHALTQARTHASSQCESSGNVFVRAGVRACERTCWPHGGRGRMRDNIFRARHCFACAWRNCRSGGYSPLVCSLPGSTIIK